LNEGNNEHEKNVICVTGGEWNRYDWIAREKGFQLRESRRASWRRGTITI
jgi:hypothetical protein